MKTVFLDRDGVINRKLPGDYVKSWDEFEFLPGAMEGLSNLKRLGFRLIVVTNQRGISLGKFSEGDLERIHSRMQEELGKCSAALDAIYYCPHENGRCECRKPGTGLFERARQDFPDLNFRDSFVIGDSFSDMEAGAKIGAKLILVGQDAAAVSSTLRRNNIHVDEIAPSLREAVQRFVVKIDQRLTSG